MIPKVFSLTILSSSAQKEIRHIVQSSPDVDHLVVVIVVVAAASIVSTASVSAREIIISCGSTLSLSLLLQTLVLQEATSLLQQLAGSAVT